MTQEPTLTFIAASAAAENGRFFVGRTQVFSWLEQHLARRSPTQPLVLYGPDCSGKTAVLQEIAYGRLGPNLLVIYVDFERLLRDSLSIFLHDVAQTAVVALRDQHLSLPDPHQPDFIVNPYKAFQDHLLQPVLNLLNGRKLLFLGDNLNVIFEQTDAGVFASQTFEAFYRLIHAQTNTYSLFTLTAPDSTILPLGLPSLETIPTLRLDPLSPPEVAAWLREVSPTPPVKDVTDYVYELTGGHPGTLQTLNSALADWQTARQLRHLTVADVAAVAQNQHPRLAPNGQALPPFAIQRAAPPPPSTYRMPYQTSSVSRNVLLVGGALALLAVAIIVAPFILRSRPVASLNNTPPPISETAVFQTSEALAAVIIAQTPTVTAVPTTPPTDTPAPTSTPTVTPTPAPTETPSPTLTPTPDSLPLVRTREADGMAMRLIAAGSFLMGSSDEDVYAASDEKPQHEVTLSDFYLDQYEVTVAQYAAFLNRLGTYRQACEGFDCALTRDRTGITNFLLEEEVTATQMQYLPLTGFSNYPANHISWYGAKAYCEAMGARLPTEAEWEYAARGTDGRLYPWGNEAPSEVRAVFNSDNFDNLKPVNALPMGQSPFEIFGMAGSMWEWTADWYDETYYASSPTVNPTGPETGLMRVIRGGAWPYNNEADRVRAANRSSMTPDFISATVGFRCAQNP